MLFDFFLELISDIESVKLPGVISHKKFESKIAKQKRKSRKLDDSQAKVASVLLLVYPKGGESYMAFIVRTSGGGVHSGQVAFPGGKYEENDLNYCYTAKRETEEEVGVASIDISLIKTLSKVYIPVSNFLVHPFLGYIDYCPKFVLEAAEVDSVLEIPIRKIIDDTYIEQVNVNTSNTSTYMVNAFKIEKSIIWGATAMMLSEFKDIIKHSV